eukprot:833169-Prymnesium_polylepis.1
MGKVVVVEVRIGPARLRHDAAEPAASSTVDGTVEVASQLALGGARAGDRRAAVDAEGRRARVVARPRWEVLSVVAPWWPHLWRWGRRGG